MTRPMQSSSASARAVPAAGPGRASQARLLGCLAKKYIWWKTPEEAVAFPQRVIAQVMNMGDYGDVLTLAAQLGDDALRDTLASAEAGQFSDRSWAYWHYRLGMAEVDRLPPLPQRSFG